MIVNLSRKSNILFLSILFILLFNFVEAATFHTILIGDTKSDLSQQALADIASMQTQTRDLIAALGMNHEIRILKNEKVSRENVLTTIDSLKVKKDDLLLFYFSGHGCRTEMKKSTWPYLYFAGYQQYMALDEIVDHLKAKHPKFGLVIADCCNNYPGVMPQKTFFNFRTLDRRKINPSIKSLFMRSNGFLVITGAEPGGYSWASKEGGILTCALLDGLSQDEYHPSKTWEDIMGGIREKTRGIQRPQHAFISN